MEVQPAMEVIMGATTRRGAKWFSTTSTPSPCARHPWSTSRGPVITAPSDITAMTMSVAIAAALAVAGVTAPLTIAGGDAITTTTAVHVAIDPTTVTRRLI